MTLSSTALRNEVALVSIWSMVSVTEQYSRNEVALISIWSMVNDTELYSRNEGVLVSIHLVHGQ